MVSKTAIKQVEFSINQFTKRNKDRLSYESCHGLNKRLKAMYKELHELGYTLRNINKIKQKHVEALVDHWKSKELSSGTIKNRMSDLRFVCKSFGRSSVVKKNDEYDIEKRSYQPTSNKAIIGVSFSGIKDQHLRLSLELQKAFGLRREECIKIMPHIADKGDKLWLKGSWTKGKVERLIPITNKEQRVALNKAKLFVKKFESLIPRERNYIKQRHLYNTETRENGLNNLHGLRHAYAQRRYKEITGMNSPICGGKKRNQMCKIEIEQDRVARKLISNELGHSRSSITKVYIG